MRRNRHISAMILSNAFKQNLVYNQIIYLYRLFFFISIFSNATHLCSKWFNLVEKYLIEVLLELYLYHVRVFTFLN